MQVAEIVVISCAPAISAIVGVTDKHWVIVDVAVGCAAEGDAAIIRVVILDATERYLRCGTSDLSGLVYHAAD